MVDFLYLFKDINFQKGFLIVAILILLMVILNVAYKLSKDDSGQVQPIIAPCPDFWDVSGNYCINTSGQNIGFEGGGEYSIWNAAGVTCGVGGSDPYTSNTPIQCTDSNLRTIPVGTMYYQGSKTNKLVGGELKDGKFVDIKKKRAKASRTNWANKYGFAWDGLKTKW
jgi:hypothetical protein